MHTLISKIRLPFVMVLISTVIACGPRHLENPPVEIEPVPPSAHGEVDDYISNLLPYYNSIDDLLRVSIVIRGSKIFKYIDLIIDHKNGIFRAKLDDEEIDRLSYNCLEEISKQCLFFKINGLPLSNDSLYLHRGIVEITDLETNAVVSKTIFSAESPHLQTNFALSNVYFSAEDNAPGIAYFYYRENAFSINGISIPGQLPKDFAFYSSECTRSKLDRLTYKIECTYVDKFTAAIINKSWQLKFIN